MTASRWSVDRDRASVTIDKPTSFEVLIGRLLLACSSSIAHCFSCSVFYLPTQFNISVAREIFSASARSSTFNLLQFQRLLHLFGVLTTVVGIVSVWLSERLEGFVCALALIPCQCSTLSGVRFISSAGVSTHYASYPGISRVSFRFVRPRPCLFHLVWSLRSSSLACWVICEVR